MLGCAELDESLANEWKEKEREGREKDDNLLFVVIDPVRRNSLTSPFPLRESPQ